MIQDLIYLYCLTNKVPKLKEIETLVNSIYFIHSPKGSRVLDHAGFIFYQGLYAVTGRVSADEFSEENLKKNLSNLDWITAKASAHEKVIETVMQNSCVIPFKFGAIFNAEENLKTMLKKHIKEFKDTLNRLEGKEEWGVKIYCDMGKLKENLIQDNKELLSLDKEINSASPGKAFILKKKKEELVNIIVNKKLNECGRDSFERLKQYSVEFCINKLLPQEVTERKDNMILNSVFLVEKDGIAGFIDSVDILKRIFTPLGLFFDHTGPWPPYNFCGLSGEKAQNG